MSNEVFTAFEPPGVDVDSKPGERVDVKARNDCEVKIRTPNVEVDHDPGKSVDIPAEAR